jgi:hypothetical protein
MGVIDVNGAQVEFDGERKYMSIGPVDPTAKPRYHSVYFLKPGERLRDINAAPVMAKISLEMELALIEEALQRGDTPSENVAAFRNTQDLYNRVLQVLQS